MPAGYGGSHASMPKPKRKPAIKGLSRSSILKGPGPKSRARISWPGGKTDRQIFAEAVEYGHAVCLRVSFYQLAPFRGVDRTGARVAPIAPPRTAPAHLRMCSKITTARTPVNRPCRGFSGCQEWARGL